MRIEARAALLIVLAACVEKSKGGDIEFVDAGSGSGSANCASDSEFEPNDAVTAAFETPIDGQKSFIQSELAICPVTDRDIFALNIGAVTTLDAVAFGATDSAALDVSILNAAGTKLASGAFSDGAMRVSIPNVPTGGYFVSVTGRQQQNYALTISVK